VKVCGLFLVTVISGGKCLSSKWPSRILQTIMSHNELLNPKMVLSFFPHGTQL